jgi:predicted O-methyltransferase YrrM
MPAEMHGPDHFQRFLPRDGGLMDELERSSLERDVPIIGPSVGRLLQVIVMATGARKVLELGTANGYSTIFIAQALLPGGMITTMEWSASLAEEARINLRQAGVEDRVEVVVGDALSLMRGLGPDSFDMVFMDIEKEMYSDALPDVIRLLRDGGLLVCDNVAFRSAGDFNNRLASHPQLVTSFVYGVFHNHSPDRDALSLSVKRAGRADP